MLFSENTKLRRRRKRGKNRLEVVGGYLAKAAKVLVVSEPIAIFHAGHGKILIGWLESGSAERCR